MTTTSVQDHIKSYTARLSTALELEAMKLVPALAEALRDARRSGRYIYLCGNGGSAANGIHIANDFIFGGGMKNGAGLRVESLSASPAGLTCLGNDIGYENIYAEQVRVKGNPGDVLIVLSGSGGSPNVVKALETGKAKGTKTFAIVAYSGGKCKELARHPIHFAIGDMQIAEDLQLVVCHM